MSLTALYFVLDLDRDLDRDLERGGTFAPFLRASDNPIAIACFRLVTRPPFPLLPLSSVPWFRFRIAVSTDSLATSPYFRPPRVLPRAVVVFVYRPTLPRLVVAFRYLRVVDRFVVAIVDSR
ncbi:MAG TPA: hypothetical protein VFT29_03620 [Gemmatimonadaceae bacterium]|nr:hypothetical protein [Gemmatimonadaceae bacterium]